jgi:hypothetical protein
VDPAGPADVDVLDGLRERRAARDGLLERVERDDDQVDRRDPVRLERGHVLGDGPPGQDPPVHLGMERLDPAVQHLGKARELGHVADRHSGVPQQPRSAARRHDLDPEAVEPPGQVHRPGLVVHADQAAPNSHGLSRCRPPAPVAA